jgi:hypothetical protein
MLINANENQFAGAMRMIAGAAIVACGSLLKGNMIDANTENPLGSDSSPVTTTRRTKAQRKTETRGRKPQSACPFPGTTLQDALVLGEAIQAHGAGQKMRRMTLFDKLDKSPDSGASRMMVTNSGKYEITEGSYKAEFLSLTELGQRATSPDTSPRQRVDARFKLGIEKIAAFKHLYDTNKTKRIPSPEVLRDSLAELGVEPENREQCVNLFLENAKFLGLLKTIAGAERLIPIEQILEELPDKATTKNAADIHIQSGDARDSIKPTAVRDFTRTCFVIAPIGKDGSEHRKYSDMILESFVRRALEKTDLDVVRADKIGDPGMISEQIIQYLMHSALVIADLSFHNPNVFYELAIRHMIGKPTVHIIRKEDSIPFDLKDFRTIEIDTSEKYDLVAKLDIYRAEIANHVRIATSGTEGSNPIRSFAKNLVVQVGE